MKTLIMEKKRKFDHIIGKELTEEYTLLTKSDLDFFIGEIIRSWDEDVWVENQTDIDALFALKNGKYVIDTGDFIFCFGLREE